MKSFRADYQISCLFEDNLGEHIELVVVATESDVDTKIVRCKLVAETRKFSVVRVFGQGISDEIRKQATNHRSKIDIIHDAVDGLTG